VEFIGANDEDVDSLLRSNKLKKTENEGLIIFEDDDGEEGEFQLRIPFEDLVFTEKLSSVERENLEEEKESILRWFGDLYIRAVAGDCDAQSELGSSYDFGVNFVVVSTDKALLWYSKAANRGHAYAQNNLAALLHTGHSGRVAPDVNSAIQWYTKAAEQKVPSACFGLGVLYFLRSKTQKDYEESARWFLEGSRLGHEACTINAAVLMCTKFKNFEMGIALLIECMQTGSAIAAFNVGIARLLGWGLQQDEHEAERLFLYAEKSFGDVAALRIRREQARMIMILP